MGHGKIRIVLLGHTKRATEILQQAIAADGIFTVCGEIGSWGTGGDLLDREVPDVLIARRGTLPADWQVSGTSLLWAADSTTLDVISASVTPDANAASALRKELWQIYAHVLNAKAQQLRSLLQAYQESIGAKTSVTELRARCDEGEVIVPIHHVEWIEGAGNWVRIHTPHGVYPLREMINAVLEKLPDSQFVRIHRSTVVNRSRIAEVTVQNDVPIALVMQSGVSLSVGVTFREPLRENSLLQSRQAS